jgi:hypothetical protein
MAGDKAPDAADDAAEADEAAAAGPRVPAGARAAVLVSENASEPAAMDVEGDDTEEEEVEEQDTAAAGSSRQAAKKVTKKSKAGAGGGAGDGAQAAAAKYEAYDVLKAADGLWKARAPCPHQSLCLDSCHW